LHTPDILPGVGSFDESTFNHHVGHLSGQGLNASSTFASHCKNLSKMLLSISQKVKLAFHGSGVPKSEVSGNRIGKIYG
jgi:hypothetical protein